MSRRRWILGALGVAVLGLLVRVWLGETNGEGESAGGPKPLYWVAPMDPNYRRDQPGKSPMGMDLVPVFAEDLTVDGLVRIDPIVQQSIGVTTAQARRGQLRQILRSVGYVDVNEAGLWRAFPRFEGWIEQLHVSHVGQAVNTGDPLFDVYSPALVAVQEEYLAALAAGNPTLTAAAESRLKSLQVADSTLAQLRSQGRVQRTITRVAPQNGVVTQLNVRSGHFVRPDTAVLELATLEDVWITVPLFEADAAAVGIGDPLELTFAGLGDSRRTAVDFVSPLLDPDTRTLQVRGTLANPELQLRPGMFGSARIELLEDRERLLIPRQALIRTAQGDRVVISLANDRFRSVAVTVGRSTADDVEIVSGLEVGDRVVTSAQFLIDSESDLSTGLERMSSPAEAAAPRSHAMDHDT